MRDVSERLRDVLDAIENIERYSAKGKSVFEADELVQTWFLYQLQTIGEAIRSIPDEIRQQAPGIAWSNITGMRNILVHGYFNIDTDIVWDAVVNDIPPLKAQIAELLDKLVKG